MKSPARPTIHFLKKHESPALSTEQKQNTLTCRLSYTVWRPLRFRHDGREVMLLMVWANLLAIKVSNAADGLTWAISKLFLKKLNSLPQQRKIFESLRSVIESDKNESTSYPAATLLMLLTLNNSMQLWRVSHL